MNDDNGGAEFYLLITYGSSNCECCLRLPVILSGVSAIVFLSDVMNCLSLMVFLSGTMSFMLLHFFLPFMILLFFTMIRLVPVSIILFCIAIRF